MTADRLDEQAEARIREACGVVNHANPELESWQDYTASPKCTCRIQRAAILADREARETDESEEVEASFGDLLDKWAAERAHADALAEALRACTDEKAERLALDMDHSNRDHSLWYTSVKKGRKLLAAHDKLRGR